MSEWACGDCGSRRLSGSPDEGWLCLDCGRHARGEMETESAFGFSGAFDDPVIGDLQEEMFRRLNRMGSVDARSFEGHPHSEAWHEGFGPEDPPQRPEPRARTHRPAGGRAPDYDRWSPLRCSCCFELAARCRRKRSRFSSRCCLICRCSG